MAGERIDYTAAAVEAAKSVLIELMHILGEYRDDMVLVGGWIPDLLIPTSLERHVGSIDVDVALNHRELTEAGYRMIGEILRQHGYTPDPQQPFIFRKAVRGQMVQASTAARVRVDALKGPWTCSPGRRGAATWSFRFHRPRSR
jgi:hypothetical protein